MMAPQSKMVRAFVVLLLLTGLVLVRAFENILFYDPFLSYFKGEYSNQSIPQFDDLKLFGGLFFRYLLNAVFSLGIIYFAFLDYKAVRFISILYVVLFIVLIAALWLTINLCPDCRLAIFYERRFLIQPLFLLLFLPAIYYQRQVVKK
jgi:exosortase F-associated protein